MIYKAFYSMYVKYVFISIVGINNLGDLGYNYQADQSKA